MSMQPPYAERIRIPHQPRPPAHEPMECAEVLSHEWLRVFRCGKCGRTHTYMRDELLPEDGVACYGDGTHLIQEDLRP